MIPLGTDGVGVTISAKVFPQTFDIVCDETCVQGLLDLLHLAGELTCDELNLTPTKPLCQKLIDNFFDKIPKPAQKWLLNVCEPILEGGKQKICKFIGCNCTPGCPPGTHQCTTDTECERNCGDPSKKCCVANSDPPIGEMHQVAFEIPTPLRIPIPTDAIAACSKCMGGPAQYGPEEEF
jgi:hypothetical protein